MNAVDQIPNRQETLMHSPEQQALNGGHNGKNQHQSHHVEETDEQDQRLFFALDGSNDGLWDWDMVSDTVYFSPRWLEMIGYQPDELPHTFATWEALVHPDDYVRVERVIQDHIYEDIPYEAEFRMRAKDGQWKWIMARGKVVEHNEQGIPLRMTGVHTDIDQRKREQEELQRNRALLQGMLDALPAVVYVKDLETG
ncbi:MAG: PAS domain-containing protein [Chloroflexaceae bacterium]|nr:PAS domain-containing protein [Chloroflexaceae bacterium]